MVFSSTSFLYVFLPLFLCCYVLIPQRNLVILFFSLLFFTWGESYYVILLLGTVVFNYLVGRKIGQSNHNKLLLGAGVPVLGFNRQTNIWFYPYKDFSVSKHNQQPEWIKRYYPSAGDFAHFQSMRPASDRTALLLSNSFGAFVAPHLAPGFKDLYHININHLAAENTQPLMEAMLESYPISDVIYLVHDGGLMNNFKLNQLSIGMQGIVAENQAK